MDGDGTTAGYYAEAQVENLLAQEGPMFLSIFECEECRCTVNNAPDLQKAGGEPSFRSPKCCEL